MTARHLYLCALLAFPAAAAAQTGYTIAGSMSNFDCTNRCDSECDEMEIQIEGIHPEDVVHTYRNGNYGSPTVTLSADGTYTIIDYRNPAHATPVNTIEHFGISLAGATSYGPAATHPTRVRWFRSGQPATVNGHLPTVGGGSAPATQPIMPSIHATVTPGTHGQGGVALTVTNNDQTQCIWIKRRAQITAGEVTLEALMPDNPVVTTSVQIDNSPLYMTPGQTITMSNDLIEVEEVQSAVFSAQYYQNLTNSGPFSQNLPGPELGNIMTSTTANPQLPCAHSIPTIIDQPASVEQDADTRVDLRVTGRGDDASPLTYQWMKEGVALANGNGFSGTDTNHLRINHLTAATEGFYSVRITNTCATILSHSALVFITGHNSAPIRTAVCPAITAQPQPLLSCSRAPSVFTVAASGSDTLSYRWKCVSANGTVCGDLTDGLFSDAATGLSYTVAGAATSTLSITDVQLGSQSNVLFFAATATNPCGSVASDPVALTVVPVCSVADLGLNGTCPDGVVDGSDFVAFINSFSVGDASIDALADIDGDGIIDGNDFIGFINAFSAGC